MGRVRPGRADHLLAQAGSSCSGDPGTPGALTQGTWTHGVKALSRDTLGGQNTEPGPTPLGHLVPRKGPGCHSGVGGMVQPQVGMPPPDSSTLTQGCWPKPRGWGTTPRDGDGGSQLGRDTGQPLQQALPRENPRGYSTEGLGRPPLAIWYPARGLGATRGLEALSNPRWECPCQTFSHRPWGVSLNHGGEA